MAKKEKIEDRAWEILQREAEKLGLKGVDAEYLMENKDHILRLTVDKDGGVGIDDCEALSRAVDPVLDEEDFIPDVYTLEVTSPGLGRPLRRPRDYEFGRGKEVEIKTYAPVEGQKEFRGVLTDYDADTVTVRIGDAEKKFEKAALAMIRLAFDF